MNILSLGAGVQSTTLLLMSDVGELPRLDYAIFADTGAEPQAVYDHLGWLKNTVDIPLLIVSAGNLREDLLAPTRPTIHVGQPPFFVRNAAGDGTDAGGMLWRKCTKEYKIQPIEQAIRRLLGLKKRQRVPAGTRIDQWIGFSVEELGRTFCSTKPWIRNRFPLIEQRMRRQHCEQWLQTHGFPIPAKSSCIFCPYHSNHYWRQMRDERQQEWASAVTFEAQLQAQGLPGVTGTPYLHRSLVPLPMVDLSTPEDDGQLTLACMACAT